MSYEDAAEVSGFIEADLSDDNYSTITPGGLCIQVEPENWQTVLDFIKSLNQRFEISDEHPMSVEKNIVSNLKRAGII